MKIAIAQNRPKIGTVQANLAGHQTLIEIAATQDAQLVVFPELSLTGYQPCRAAELACAAADPCFELLQSLCEQHKIALAVGLPMFATDAATTANLPRISLLLFRPGHEPLVYSKQHLHADELPCFEAGPTCDGVFELDSKVGFSICFELSVKEHAERAFHAGAVVYIASVAKTLAGVKSANQRLAEIARLYSAPVLMANCLGMLDGVECVGKSAVWDRDGNQIAQLDDKNEGIIVYDSDTNQITLDSLGRR